MAHVKLVVRKILLRVMANLVKRINVDLEGKKMKKVNVSLVQNTPDI